jgi:cytochrome c-type biogenesis protein
MDGAPAWFAALGAGTASSISPAVLPLVPAFLALAWNRGAGDRAALILGFCLLFVGLGAGATLVGQTLLAHLTLCERAAGALLVAMGVRGLLRQSSTTAGGILSLAAGAALAFGWTPLAGPVLAQILAVATSADAIGPGVALLALYAVGATLPWLALGALLQHATRSMSDRGTAAKRLAGCTVTITGALIVAGMLPRMAAALVPFLPLA